MGGSARQVAEPGRTHDNAAVGRGKRHGTNPIRAGSRAERHGKELVGVIDLQDADDGAYGVASEHQP